MQFQGTVKTSYSIPCWQLSCGRNRWTFRIWQPGSARNTYTVLPHYQRKLLQKAKFCVAANAVPRDSENQLQHSVLAAFLRVQKLDISNLEAVLRENEIQSVDPYPTITFEEHEYAGELLWTADKVKAFKLLKQALMTTPALELPDYNKPFTLFVHEAAAALLVEQSEDVVFGSPLLVPVPHELEMLLSQHLTQAMSPQQIHHHELIRLTAENRRIKRRKTLNPATLLPAPGEKTPRHDCVVPTREAEKAQKYLTDGPFPDPNPELGMDGSSHDLNRNWVTGYSGTTENGVVEASPLSL
ncbi:hypothetical protein QYF61_009729 [Mycteria americana]|uniref:Uncharacterized protein n=1 Tax=Mycteria americana TaxID=33587 RepID=A0AAN7NBY3_MYCAM|nr:hypothetical protein QYF61_009729 [Mycteria americana]